MAAYEYDGFFAAAMDTFKDKQQLGDLYESGQPPWEVWRVTAAELQDATAKETDPLANLRGAPGTQDERAVLKLRVPYLPRNAVGRGAHLAVGSDDETG